MSPKRGLALGELKKSNFARFALSGTAYESIPGAMGGSTTGTGLQVINRVLYFPMIVNHPIQVDRLSIAVQAAGAGSTTSRLGIYHADEELQPLGLIVDAGTVAVDATGVKNLAVSPAALLTPGRYLLAMNTDGTPTLRSVRPHFMDWGFLAPETTGQNRVVSILRANQTYAAFPDPGTAITSADLSNQGYQYMVFLRTATP